MKAPYVCQNCAATYTKWIGRCAECGAWNSLELEAKTESTSNKRGVALDATKLSEVTGADSHLASSRIVSNIGELDRTLGGGLVIGSAVLVGGEPGIGKSTLLLEFAMRLHASGVACLYVSGEESIQQISLHASRLAQGKNLPDLHVLSATNVHNIIATMSTLKPSVVFIDSVQTMFVPEVDASPGTVSQVRISTHELMTFAKSQRIALVLVGHVTKEGQIAGPKILEHMVDAVLYFEGERGGQYRILRAVKNRFGSLNEIGVFEMTESGLKEVSNPSAIFLSSRKLNVSGSVVFASMEGSRPMLMEVQALVSHTHMASPRRAVVGWDLNRLSMMIAVLANRFGANLNSYEVYLNVVGGLKVVEPAADLAALAALLSAFYNVAVPSECVFFGEVGLAGEVRRVSGSNARIKEAHKLGFTKAILPASTELSKQAAASIEMVEMHQIKQLSQLFKKTGAQ